MEIENGAEEKWESESQASGSNSEPSAYQPHSMGALEILRETVRVLRFNASAFLLITAVLISPVSALLLSNVLVDKSIVNQLNVRLLLTVKSSGLPLSRFVKQLCYRFSDTIVSAVTCYPLLLTLLLLSKAAVVYSVDCTYSRNEAEFSKFRVILKKIWKRVVSTYLWTDAVIVGCVTLFCVLLVSIITLFAQMGYPQEVNLYLAIMLGVMFSVMFANCIVICNVAVVISALEDVAGPQALLRASGLIRGQTQVGLLIYLGSTIGMMFVEGLFEHRVKTLSYGDGSSRVWEGPLLVVMYSFVVLIDCMMSTVFYFSCKSYRMEGLEGECPSILESSEFL